MLSDELKEEQKEAQYDPICALILSAIGQNPETYKFEPSLVDKRFFINYAVQNDIKCDVPQALTYLENIGLIEKKKDGNAFYYGLKKDGMSLIKDMISNHNS